MKAKKRNDDFSEKSQVTARLKGEYDRIAKEAESSGRCVFCNLKKKYIIAEEDGWVLTVNLFPRSTGDLVVIPRRHVERYEDLNLKDAVAIKKLNDLGMKLLGKTLNLDSFYLLIRDGQGTDKTVKHLHGQIMNYWKGLIDWHPQKNPMLPLEVAKKMKATLRKIKNGKS